MGLVLKLGFWVHRDLNDSQKKKPFEVCQQVISMKRKCNWLDHLVTGDEKWVIYVNHTGKQQWFSVDQVPEPKQCQVFQQIEKILNKLQACTF